MKFEGSGSKGTQVIEQKRSVTDGQTDRRTRQKQYVSPKGGRHNYREYIFWRILQNVSVLCYYFILFDVKILLDIKIFNK